jgi:hypothetical protein
MKLEATRYSKMSVDFQRTTRLYILVAKLFMTTAVRISNPTYAIYDLKLSWRQYTMSCSRVINRVNVELGFNETRFVSITGRWWVLSSHTVFKHTALVHLSLNHVGTGHHWPSEATHRSSHSLLSIQHAHTPLITWTCYNWNRDSLWNVRH